MPAWTEIPRRALGAKLVMVIPGNAAQNLPTHRAVVLLFDPATGETAAWVDGEAVTRDRTAAVSVVATRALTRRPHGVHAILGAGVQGRAHALAFAKAGPVERFVVWSPSPARAANLVSDLRARGLAATAFEDVVQAVRDADVVTTCTAAMSPLLPVEAIAEGAHINAVGASLPDRREIPGTLIGASALVVDDLAAAERESGDVILAVAEGAASWDGVVSLGAVLTGQKAPRPGRVSVFVSLGLGIEDVATAAAVVEQASAFR
jgi:ornithine cyclodeaminase/alanine dehydrogenase-like protein (mu-crystallin family)